jgi:uncharacterized protein YciI
MDQSEICGTILLSVARLEPQPLSNDAWTGDDNMQYLIMAYDGKDDKAQERRQAARPDHLVLAEKMRDAGSLLYGAAMLDDSGLMIGSMLVCEFEDRKKVDEWFEHEPYVKGNVWQKIDVIPCKTAPMFVGLKPQKV